MGQWDWLLSSLISLLCMHLTGSLHGGKSDQLNQRAIESKAIGGSQLYNRDSEAKESLRAEKLIEAVGSLGRRPICSEYLSCKAEIGHFAHTSHLDDVLSFRFKCYVWKDESGNVTNSLLHFH